MDGEEGRLLILLTSIPFIRYKEGNISSVAQIDAEDRGFATSKVVLGRKYL